MSDSDSQDQQHAIPGEGRGRINIQKIYIKDASFEAPNSPQIFSQPWQPEISVQLQNAAMAVADNVYEVVLTVTITARLGEKTAYLVEVHQAGLFEMLEVPQDKVPRLLGSYCPYTLFPYLRQALDDLVGKGGFPEFLLAPINFDAIFEEQMAKRQQEQAAAADSPTH